MHRHVRSTYGQTSCHWFSANLDSSPLLTTRNSRLRNHKLTKLQITLTNTTCTCTLVQISAYRRRNAAVHTPRDPRETEEQDAYRYIYIYRRDFPIWRSSIIIKRSITQYRVYLYFNPGRIYRRKPRSASHRILPLRYFLHHLERIVKPPTHSRVATNLSYPIPCSVCVRQSPV